MTTPEGQIEHFAEKAGLTFTHAKLVMEENLQIGDHIPVYIKNSRTQRYPLEIGEMVVHFHKR